MGLVHHYRQRATPGVAREECGSACALLWKQRLRRHDGALNVLAREPPGS